MSREVRLRTSTENQAIRNLHRIAAALNLPETAFYDDRGSPTDLAGASELLRIWTALPNDADRRTVLAFARTVAAEGGR